MSVIKFIVSKEIRRMTSMAIVDEVVYLQFMDYNPYCKPITEFNPLYTADSSEAFHFLERSAAEIAAVFIGGKVEVLQ